MIGNNAPWLPGLLAMRIDMALGWAMVMGFLAAALSWWANRDVRRTIAILFVLWALVPGVNSVSYWLGLAFRAPSFTTVLVCAWWLYNTLWAPSPPAPHGQGLPARSAWWWPVAGALLGYLMLLDTFAQLPLQLYAWGFSNQAVWCLLGAALAPWVLCGPAYCRNGLHWLVPLALALFVLTRLPTGNVWDALLDPWLWVAAQGQLLWLVGRWLRARWRRWRDAAPPATPG